MHSNRKIIGNNQQHSQFYRTENVIEDVHIMNGVFDYTVRLMN
jgi:hypothetical protein